LGISIFLTTLLAILTGANTFFVCFDNPGLSIFAGIVWGAIIFNLDRSFVVSVSYQSGWVKATIVFLTRFVMAVIISLSFSTTIEIRIFEKEINAEVDVILIKEYQALIDNDIAKIQEKIDKIDIFLQQTQSAKDKAVIDKNNALDKLNTSTLRGRDRERLRQNAQDTNQAVQDLSQEIKTESSKRQELSKKLKDLQISNISNDIDKKRGGKKSNQLNSPSTKPGLIDKYSALESIVKRRNLQYFNYLIMAIVAMVEISPLLLKTMYSEGNYERMIEERSNREKNKYTKEIELEDYRFSKAMEITKGRLDLDESFADSKLHPSNLLLSNGLIRDSEDSLRSNSDEKRSKEFVFYTEEEKKDPNSQYNTLKSKGIFARIQDQIDEIGEKFNKMEEKEKNKLKFGSGGALIVLITVFTNFGTFAEKSQAMLGLFKDVILPIFAIK
jgi:Domain of unknown function (DUF4407)